MEASSDSLLALYEVFLGAGGGGGGWGRGSRRISDALYLQDWRNGPRGLFNEENHFITAASGSKSTNDGPSSEIPMRSSRVYPPRKERESFSILFCTDYALSQLSSGDRKNQ